MFDKGSKREILLEIVTVLVNAIGTNEIVIEERAVRDEESRNRIDQAIRQAESIIREEGQ